MGSKSKGENSAESASAREDFQKSDRQAEAKKSDRGDGSTTVPSSRTSQNRSYVYSGTKKPSFSETVDNFQRIFEHTGSYRNKDLYLGELQELQGRLSLTTGIGPLSVAVLAGEDLRNFLSLETWRRIVPKVLDHNDYDILPASVEILYKDLQKGFDDFLRLYLVRGGSNDILALIHIGMVAQQSRTPLHVRIHGLLVSPSISWKGVMTEVVKTLTRSVKEQVGVIPGSDYDSIRFWWGMDFRPIAEDHNDFLENQIAAGQNNLAWINHDSIFFYIPDLKPLPQAYLQNMSLTTANGMVFHLRHELSLHILKARLETKIQAWEVEQQKLKKNKGSIATAAKLESEITNLINRVKAWLDDWWNKKIAKVRSRGNCNSLNLTRLQSLVAGEEEHYNHDPTLQIYTLLRENVEIGFLILKSPDSDKEGERKEIPPYSLEIEYACLMKNDQRKGIMKSLIDLLDISWNGPLVLESIRDINSILFWWKLGFRPVLPEKEKILEKAITTNSLNLSILNRLANDYDVMIKKK